MSDLIERQEIIDRLDRVIIRGVYDDFYEGHLLTAEAVKETILSLPSAQPERASCKQVTGKLDLISRQDAIDAIMSEPPEAHYPSWYAEQIKALQSAERKKGEWIATYSDFVGDVWVSWKCSNCGYVRKKGWKYNGVEKPDVLFCEMCNADMRGEQDG